MVKFDQKIKLSNFENNEYYIRINSYRDVKVKWFFEEKKIELWCYLCHN